METISQKDTPENTPAALTNKVIPKKVKKTPYLKYVIVIAVVFILTLPFHYVPSQMKIFPKDNFTFNNTFIFQSDINKMINRYNNASLFEKISIANEPLYKKLKEKGIIYLLDKSPSDNSEESNATQNSIDNVSSTTSAEPKQSEEYSVEDNRIIEKIKAKVKRDWPNDYAVQKMMYDQGIESYLYMKTVTDLKIKKKVSRDWPNDYTVQKMMYDQEVDAKEKMK